MEEVQKLFTEGSKFVLAHGDNHSLSDCFRCSVRTWWTATVFYAKPGFVGTGR